MWSDNKKVDYLVNTLIFLVAINFMHYGQLFLPIICLILFIDNKFKFKVNNIKIFVILGLFAISFCYFSYELGFYCVMGFTLPMAYYIGSNIRVNDKNNIKKLIYIIMFGMALHVILNFAYDFNYYGFDIINHSTRRDFWTKLEISQTATATNMIPIIAMLYYVCKFETDTKIKRIYFVGFLFVMIYELFLGRRMPLFMLIISIAVSFILDEYVYRLSKVNKRALIRILSLVLIVSIMLFLLVTFDVFGFRDYFFRLSIVKKIVIHGLNPGRFDIFIKAIPILKDHLWGGQIISTILKIQIHDLWLDIYDYAGIIPLLLMLIYSVNLLNVLIKQLKIKNKLSLLTFVVELCMFIELFLEPMITGSSIFLICFIAMIEATNRLNN